MNNTLLPHITLREWLLMAGFVLLALLIAWPGLHGAFLLDDFPNLASLASLADNATVGGFWTFLESGVSGPTGRPVALLTFALQADAWPHNPLAFKAVNLALHLAAGCLFFLVFRLLAGNRKEQWIVLIAAGWWLLHPIHASTVFYVVQRMTQLSAIFMLLAVFAALKGRAMMLTGRIRGGLVVASSGYVLAGLLGVFSKENAVLLPLLMLAVELSRPASDVAPRLWKTWRYLFIVLPLALGSLYFLLRIDTFLFESYTNRDFNAWQRLLTEARVLADYQWKLLVPVPSNLGLYFDWFRVSDGILTPPTTLLAIAWHGLLLGTAWCFRRSLPLFALGIFWFYGGHALEAGPLNLELYFEHRNYLPGYGFLLALLVLVNRLPALATTRGMRTVILLAPLPFILFHATVMNMEARLWGNPTLQTTIWAQQNPDSLRAQTELVKMHLDQQEFDKGADLLADLAARHPGSPGIATLQLSAHCVTDTIAIPGKEQLVHSWTGALLDPAPYFTIDRIISWKENGQCSAVPDALLHDVLVDVAESADEPIIQRQLTLYRARLFRTSGHEEQAVALLDEAFSIVPDGNINILKAIWLLQSGNIDAARAALEDASAPPDPGLIEKLAFHERRDAVARLIDHADRTAADTPSPGYNPTN